MVAEEVKIRDATEEVADNQDEVGPTCEEVAEVAENQDEVRLACEEVAEEMRLIPYWERTEYKEAQRTQP